MSDIGYEDLSKDELQQLTTALIKSKLITKYNKEQFFETNFEEKTMNELINKPRIIQMDKEKDMAYVIISKEG